MCGIAGIFHPDPACEVNSKVLERMTRILSYRGPDEEGYYFGEGVGLGHRRLSIIDISGGKQPVHNENGKIWVVYNGEVFNYLEIMDLLKKKGHRFYSRCDTEVLVHLYEEYGEDFVEKLNGQFAIALWDSRKRQLILARDRAGIRPLYYTQLADGSVIFGSEIKSIFCHPAIHPKLDPVGLEQIFTLWVPVPPRTAFAGIKELMPGCILKLKPSGMTHKRYWKLSFPDKDSYDDKPLTYYSEQLKELLYDAVTIRLRADVPVAAYLSGGLDSSIISALVKKYHNNDLLTFSVTFKNSDFDEGVHQNVMVDFLKTDHRSIEINDDLIGATFGDIVWHTEIPMIRTAPAPLFALSQLVRHNNIKVVLTGEGADEIFGGYNIFKENKIRRFWAKFPDSKIRPLLLQELYPYIKNHAAAKSYWQLFFKTGLQDTSNIFYSHQLRWNNTSRIKRFFSNQYSENFNQETNIYGELENFIDHDINRWHPLCQAQYLEIVLFMSGYLLSSQGDRMMMGHSVEGRFPFLDYRVIEFASTVPPQFKIQLLNEKYLLKAAYKRLIPDSVLSRAKQPYRAPIADCFIKKSDYIASKILSKEAIDASAIFDRDSVKNLLQKAGTAGNQISEVDNMAIAAIVSTQLLYHLFITEIAPEDKSVKSTIDFSHS